MQSSYIAKTGRDSFYTVGIIPVQFKNATVSNLQFSAPVKAWGTTEL